MILRIDDTDVERNTQTSLDSIFDGLNWLDLGWDEFYRQSDRGDLHRSMALKIFEKGLAYRDFTPALADSGDKSHAGGAWMFNPGMRELSNEESDRRAAAGIAGPLGPERAFSRIHARRNCDHHACRTGPDNDVRHFRKIGV